MNSQQLQQECFYPFYDTAYQGSIGYNSHGGIEDNDIISESSYCNNDFAFKGPMMYSLPDQFYANCNYPMISPYQQNDQFHQSYEEPHQFSKEVPEFDCTNHYAIASDFYPNYQQECGDNMMKAGHQMYYPLTIQEQHQYIPQNVGTNDEFIYLSDQ